MVKLCFSVVTSKMAKPKTPKKSSSINICGKPDVNMSKQAKTAPVKAVHRTSRTDKEVLALEATYLQAKNKKNVKKEAKNTHTKAVHRTSRMKNFFKKEAKNTPTKAVHRTSRMKKRVLHIAAMSTPRAALHTLQNGTSSSKKSKKLKIPKLTSKEYNEFGLFVGGLNFDSTAVTVSQHFSQFGNVLKCIIPRDRKEKDLNQGFGIIYLDSQEAIDKALAAEHKLDSSTLIVTQKKKGVTVKRKREDSNQSGGDEKRLMTTSDTQLFVTRIKYSTSKDTVMEHFSQFGEVVSVNLPLLPNSTKKKSFAFVTFKEASSLKKAMADIDQEIDSAKIFIQPSKKPVARNTSYKPSHPNELYVGGLKPSILRCTLKEYFSKYGNVINVAMPLDKNGANKGFSFVSFESAASLESALEEDHEVDGQKVDVKTPESKSEDNGAASKKVNAALAASKKECHDDEMDCEDEGESDDDDANEEDDENDE